MRRFSYSHDIEELTEEEKKVVANYKAKQSFKELIAMGCLKKNSLGKLTLNTELLGIKESK